MARLVERVTLRPGKLTISGDWIYGCTRIPGISGTGDIRFRFRFQPTRYSEPEPDAPLRRSPLVSDSPLQLLSVACLSSPSVLVIPFLGELLFYLLSVALVFDSPLRLLSITLVSDSPSSSLSRTFRIKKKLAKKMRQNRPIPHWIHMRTDNTIRFQVGSGSMIQQGRVRFQNLGTGPLHGRIWVS
ncbi:hypothetical protein CRG98_013701 [Punica granatum]|uniref:Uncharacterized protein n=1 Tax=Punica granatum TaxID=22663 RepID=A0A2I0KBH6_PUNGR|nr:hypothetical protein CRG98_013701 [Punica granatum]